MLTYRLITDVVTEPISRTLVKRHLRIAESCTDEDVYLDALIASARKMVESFTNRYIGEQVWEAYLDEFSTGQILIEKYPIKVINSIKYYDENNTLQTLSSSLYDVDLKGYPCRITTLGSASWPSTYDRMNAITINFSTDGSRIAQEKALQQAFMFIVGHWYENRQDVVTGTQVNEIPKSSEYILSRYKLELVTL